MCVSSVSEQCLNVCNWIAFVPFIYMTCCKTAAWWWLRFGYRIIWGFRCRCTHEAWRIWCICCGDPYLVHGGDGQPAMLPLCHVQHGDGGSRLVPLRVITNDGFNPLRERHRAEGTQVSAFQYTAQYQPTTSLPEEHCSALNQYLWASIYVLFWIKHILHHNVPLQANWMKLK